MFLEPFILILVVHFHFHFSLWSQPQTCHNKINEGYYLNYISMALNQPLMIYFSELKLVWNEIIDGIAGNSNNC